jgi:hypothetical protein
MGNSLCTGFPDHVQVFRTGVVPVGVPSRKFPSKLLETYFGLSHTGFDDLKAAASGKTYTTPSGLALNATYVKFLRRVLPAGSRSAAHERGTEAGHQSSRTVAPLARSCP